MNQTIVLIISIASLIACAPKNQSAEESGNTVYVVTTRDTSLTDTRWKLVQINGVQVTSPSEIDKEKFIILNTNGNTVNGFSGCNTFAGTYELKGGDGIKFSQMTSTLMACDDMEMEKQFNSMLAIVGSYDITGDTLFMYQTPPTAIVRFEVARQ